jgi:hypothetical protein
MRKCKNPEPNPDTYEYMIWIRILEAQKHAVPDPQHCLEVHKTSKKFAAFVLFMPSDKEW